MTHETLNKYLLINKRKREIGSNGLWINRDLQITNEMKIVAFLLMHVSNGYNKRTFEFIKNNKTTNWCFKIIFTWSSKGTI